MTKLLFISLILFIIPIKVLAHGTEQEHALEAAVNYWGYGFVATLIAVAVFLTLFILAKQRVSKISLNNVENRDEHALSIKRANTYKWLMFSFAALSLLFLIMANVPNESVHLANQLDKAADNSGSENNNGEHTTFKHIHGLGYTSDGEEVYVPAHDGLRVFKNGVWTDPTAGEDHDYMGFSMYKDGFYSSGHPAPGSDLANPLGILKSTDMGATIDILDLYEEIDFHGMTVGYETEDIYVFNPSKNSRMDQPGFYFSTDQTKTWIQAELNGLEGQATALAAHPTKSGVVALGTNQGVYLSTDYGRNFQQLPIPNTVTAVSFDHQDNLLVGTDNGKLFYINLSTNEGKELSVPNLTGNFITYVQQNPVLSDEFVFTTSNRDIYFSNDGGKTWNQSVSGGTALVPGEIRYNE